MPCAYLILLFTASVLANIALKNRHQSSKDQSGWRLEIDVFKLWALCELWIHAERWDQWNECRFVAIFAIESSTIHCFKMLFMPIGLLLHTRNWLYHIADGDDDDDDEEELLYVNTHVFVCMLFYVITLCVVWNDCSLAWNGKGNIVWTKMPRNISLTMEMKRMRSKYKKKSNDAFKSIQAHTYSFCVRHNFAREILWFEPYTLRCVATNSFVV